MAHSPQKASAKDVMLPAAPFAQAAHPLLRAKPQPEKPKTNAALFYEDECEARLIRFYDNTRPFSKRMEDAVEMGGLLSKISNEDLAEECICTLFETMLDDTEHPSLRVACAAALGSSGAGGLVQRAESFLKSDISIDSKILVLKVLAIERSEDAIELLAMVARHGDSDRLAFAAAAELAAVPLYKARRAVELLLSALPDAFLRNPEFAAELRRMLDGCPLN